MPKREWMCESAGEPSQTNLVLRSPPNWTAVLFLGALGALHLSIWAMAVRSNRGEAYMSLVFGCGFTLAAIACYLTTYEVAVLPSERRVRLRTGCARLHIERTIAFTQIRAVRLTLAADSRQNNGRVELICDGEDIGCPPTKVARVEALCLAVTLGVRLVKVSDGAPATRRQVRTERADKLSA